MLFGITQSPVIFSFEGTLSFTRPFCKASHCLALLQPCAPFIPPLCLWWNLKEKADRHCTVFHHPPITAQPPCCQGNCTVGGSALWVKIPPSLSLTGKLQICLCKSSDYKKRPLDPTSYLNVWMWGNKSWFLLQSKLIRTHNLCSSWSMKSAQAFWSEPMLWREKTWWGRVAFTSLFGFHSFGRQCWVALGIDEEQLVGLEYLLWWIGVGNCSMCSLIPIKMQCSGEFSMVCH